MIISSILPIGPLDRFGYQYTAKMVMENHCEFFDRVYVICSSRAVKSLPISSPKIVWVQDEQSLFKLDEAGNELLDFAKLNENVNRAKDMAHRDGCDAVVELHINQYIPKNRFADFRAHCEKVVNDKQPFGWLYKAYQYFDRLYYPSHKLPWIVNLRDFGDRLRFDSDSLFLSDKHIRIEDGLFKDNLNVAVADIMGCYTERDDREKFEYYTKVLNRTYGKEGVAQEYSFAHYFEYNRNKLLQKSFATKALCAYGQEARASYPPDSFGELLIKSSGLAARIAHAIRKRMKGVFQR